MRLGGFPPGSERGRRKKRKRKKTKTTKGRERKGGKIGQKIERKERNRTSENDPYPVVYEFNLGRKRAGRFARVVYSEIYLNSASLLRKLPNFAHGPPNKKRRTKEKRNETAARTERLKPRRMTKANTRRAPTTRRNETTAHAAKDQNQNWRKQNHRHNQHRTRTNTDDRRNLRCIFGSN